MEGERLTLVCTISSGDTPLELRWTMIPSSWKTSTLLASAETGRAADNAGRRGSSATSNSVMGMIGSTGVIKGTDPKSGSFNVVNTDPYTSLLKIDKVSEVTGQSPPITSNAHGISRLAYLSLYLRTILFEIMIERFQNELNESLRPTTIIYWYIVTFISTLNLTFNSFQLNQIENILSNLVAKIVKIL